MGGGSLDTWVLPSSGRAMGPGGLEQGGWEPRHLGSLLAVWVEWGLGAPMPGFSASSEKQWESRCLGSFPAVGGGLGA